MGNKQSAKHDLDNMTRVNRSLRDDLDAVLQEKERLQKELEEKCEEFEALTDDVDRFAETFAEQHEKLQQIMSQNRKLLSENIELKTSDDRRKKKIEKLNKQLE